MDREVSAWLRVCATAGILLGRIQGFVPQWEIQDTWEGYIHLAASIPEPCRGECQAEILEASDADEHQQSRVVWAGVLQPNHVFQTTGRGNFSIMTVNVDCNEHICFSVPTSAFIVPGERKNRFHIFPNQEFLPEQDEVPMVDEITQILNTSKANIHTGSYRKVEQYSLKPLLICIRMVAFWSRLRDAIKWRKCS
eukprot:scaffold435_cov342-Pavlova_lutheri.AAC.10